MDKLAKGLLLAVAAAALAGCGAPEPEGKVLSLTGYGYTGKKHYFGFAEHLDGFMGHEVRYDVKHTHDIFANEVGGEYQARRLTEPGVNGNRIRGVWQELKQAMGPEDMYVQYSSGHGFERGLGVGVSYDEMRDAALGFGAKETIVFTMACHSGGLVESFKRREAEWQSYTSRGKTLFVMASSRKEQLSSTGPMTDPDEPGGPQGSAGSAFGHALWKALIGYADGYVDGVKDGFLSLGEIEAFTKAKTKEVGGHDPVVAGSYHPALIMNRAPSARQLWALGLEEEAARLAGDLDDEL